MKTVPDPLCAIVDADAGARAGWRPVDLAAAFLDGGVRFLQLRAKSMASGLMLETAVAIVERARQCGATVLVNDRADVARLAGADGVHVGQDDLAPAAVRALVGPSAIVGLSTHTVEQIERAVAEPITYVAIGPVFRTTTKATGYDRVGLDMVRGAAARATARGLPLVAIGGITIETARSVIDAGATSVAVISDLLAGGDPTRRAREFLQALRS
ncbi:MAG TPA: thiamine phosphate synthase [Vicinamibacterales bacterium]|nr:thiamine phosphate synthase [Vicinamibacterales bacterium]